MCKAFWKFLKTPISGGSPVVTDEEKPFVLPHPEEKPDYSRTIENTHIADVLTAWHTQWEVSDPQFWDYFHIELSMKYPYPEATISETDEMLIQPPWANPGVIAHGIAHEALSLLTIWDKWYFAEALWNALATDKMLQHLYEVKPYMKENLTEAHAEIYRYLGQHMPDKLKPYYPHLLS